MHTINMLSSAEKVKGQGVMSAYLEQVNLVKTELNSSFRTYINKFKFCDITHYHTIDFKFFLSIPLFKLKGTTVAYVHFVPETIENSLKLPFIIKKIFYKYIIWFYKSVDYLVVVNPYFIDVLSNYGIDKSRVTYIPNFVSEDNFYKYDEEKRVTLKKSFGVETSKFIVLGVGQVQTRKGVLDFIETAKKLPDIQFIWAGGFSFGSITEGYEELKKIVKNPPANVKFLGIIDRDKMNSLYNIADLMFLPSYNELFPMSILEALSLKLPVLLRDIDIYNAILFDYYLKGNSVNDFANIIRNLKNDNTIYNKWSENSARCHNFYSKEHVLKQWESFYYKISYKKIKSRSNNINGKQNI
ncbi:1,2-diacylglycerol-3-alpha-glucose alpha-1,2-galactosyltransferase [Clostridium acetobutylicum]|uniref:Glycosyltransferase n=1 Tax=Clostridium acetobutylicum (strain ATCC 824 / DSM 792 / JCM 1419 / IAM 19013 / LMG 5710 / NBRC 13948 / NRRL B-527 / VKM B-1787 / 2291 / W) TaxID=272562 RepID=Q97EU1_CLOAB|nr:MULTISPECIES: glycosyltransferase family 4 protein [Clostridium]AAK80956.1 Glycosyltransferase [Clostridium acetobutylicum ATCC 824]ADZ22058.1 Glycosyltransferase [Clostridium acetobutylicum EA 2018]AEI32648.1 glycosyltransferase [Clostridium acetobutylicum DSM 1731]AWV78633.1 glycosyltransferase [Clostridium acetobutylicum]MBC2393494.1 glycosyltransferase family 4 protein [Clostridium acetobutylicum]